MSDTSVSDQLRRRRLTIWQWVITLIYGIGLVFSAPLAMFALTRAPAEGVAETAFFFLNLSIAALPFTIALSLAAAWIYHRGGAVRAAFIPHLFPLVNIAIALILRASL